MSAHIPSGGSNVGTHEQMFALLEATHGLIRPDIFGWYHTDYPEIVDGKPKCSTGLYLGLNADASMEAWHPFGDPSDDDLETKRATVMRKADAIISSEGQWVTSSEERMVPTDLAARATSAIWLGASQVSKGLGIDGEIDGWTGDPELVDHLKILAAQFYTGRLTLEDYTMRIALAWSGVKQAVDFAGQYGVNPGTYLAMQNSIQSRMRAAARELGFAA